MFLKEIRNTFCVSDTNFVSATNVAQAGKRGNICVRNNVSATLCPRLICHRLKVPYVLRLVVILERSDEYVKELFLLHQNTIMKLAILAFFNFSN